MPRFYFAYGSNMSVAQMKRRCPAATPLRTGVLAGWRFIINRRGTASIVPDAGGVVHGVLYKTTRDCIATLDVYEGVAKRRYRKVQVQVDDNTGGTTALTYAGLHLAEGRPIRAYLAGTILPASTHWALPPGYQAELAGWLGPDTLGPTRPTPRGRGWR